MGRLLRWFWQPVNFLLILCSLIPLGIVLWHIDARAYTYPVRDQWTSYYYNFDVYDGSQVDVAVKASEGTLTVDDLFYQHTAHRIFFTKLITAVLAVTTHWNLRLEVYASLLFHIFSVAFITLLVRRHAPQLTAAVLLIASCILFSIRFGEIWQWGLLTDWVLPAVFFVALLWVLFTFPVGWRALVIAAVLALCDTFALATGLGAWPAGLVALWLRGYRRPVHYLFWVVASVLGVVLFLTGYDLNVGSRGGEIDLSLIPNMLAILSTPFITKDGNMIVFGVFLSLVGGLLLIVNAVYLWQRQANRQAVAPWLSLMVFIGIATGITGIGRAGSGAYDIINGRYGAIAGYFWIAVIVLAIYVIRQLWLQGHAGIIGAALLRINLAVGVVLIALYAIVGGDTINFARLSFDEPEACLLNYPIDLKKTCEDFEGGEESAFYQRVLALARNHLTLFQNPPAIAALRDASGDDPIIVEAPGAWPAAHIRERFPPEANIQPERVLFVLPPESSEEADSVLGEGWHYTTSGDDVQAAIEAFIGEAERVWYVRVPDDAALEAVFGTDFGIVRHSEAYADRFQPVSVTEYQRWSDAFVFGPSIRLQNWTLAESVQVVPCQSIHLNSAWATRQPLPEIYSMTLVLANAEGVGVANKDGNPSPIQTNHWQPEWIYQDMRALEVPCDLEPGEYLLLLGLYDFETLAALQVTTTEGAPVGDQLYLTTLVVQ